MESIKGSVQGFIVKIDDEREPKPDFKVRDFVIKVVETNDAGREFPQVYKMQATNEKTIHALDQYSEGDLVEVGYNLRGRKWEKDGNSGYSLNLDAWRIKGVQQHGSNEEGSEDDRPF